MTSEEIERTLQTVAENQAKHSADIAEIDRMLAASLQSQDRYDEQLSAIREIMHDLADKHLKNEERFAELAEARERHEIRMAQLEASYELFEGFVRDFKNETNQRLDGQDEANVQTESRLDALIDAQIQLTHRVDTLTADIAAVNGRLEETDVRLDRMSERAEAHDERLGRIGGHLDQAVEAIRALAEAQARTDEQIKTLLDRNGAKKPRRKSTKAAKKTTRKVKRN